MRELQFKLTFDPIDYTGALHTVFNTALPGKVVGISTYGPDRPIAIFVDDSATADDEALIKATIAGLNPAALKTNEALAAEQATVAVAAAVASFDATPDKTAWHDSTPADAVSKALTLKLDELEKRIQALEKK